jgi:hypothetical protein
MKPSLILVEGMNIAKRSEVAKLIQSKIPDADLYTCDDKTPIHLFVPMMMDVIGKRKSVIIENGWRADAVGEHFGWGSRAIAFRRMLDRIA